MAGVDRLVAAVSIASAVVVAPCSTRAEPPRSSVLWARSAEPAERDAASRDRTARADDTLTPWRRPFVVSLHGALGGPFGIAGASFEVAPTWWLVLETGAGASVHGPQFAVGTRLRVPMSARLALSAEVGLSSGRFAREQGECTLPFPCAPVGSPTRREWNQAVWGRFAPNLEGRRGRVQWRAYVGLESLLDARAASCEPPSAVDRDGCEHDGVLLPYAGGSIGFVFGPMTR